MTVIEVQSGIVQINATSTQFGSVVVDASIVHGHSRIDHVNSSAGTATQIVVDVSVVHCHCGVHHIDGTVVIGGSVIREFSISEGEIAVVYENGTSACRRCVPGECTTTVLCGRDFSSPGVDCSTVRSGIAFEST